MANKMDDELESEIENTERFRKTLKRATEAKKYQYVNEIKNRGKEIRKNPLKVEFVHVPWYKKFWRKVSRTLIGFFTKLRV